jgi:hypothetical protein
MIQKTKLQEAFSLFYGKDNLRPAFDNPLIWKDKVYATDAHVLIIVDKDEIDFEWKNEHKGHDLTTILPTPNISEILNIPDLEQYKTADELKAIGEDVECLECHGEGEVEWEYGRWTKDMDCPKCDGDGYESEAKMMPTGNKTFRDIKVKIKGNYLDIKKFHTILKAQEILGGDIELLYSEIDKGALLFKVGVCNIVVMKLREAFSDDEILELI